MNTPLSWIKAYVPDLDCTIQEYVDAMTLSGTKLEGYETLDFEEKNEFSITVYNLQNKTKCVYFVKPEKEYIPYNERDIERYKFKYR